MLNFIIINLIFLKCSSLISDVNERDLNSIVELIISETYDHTTTDEYVDIVNYTVQVCKEFDSEEKLVNESMSKLKNNTFYEVYSVSDASSDELNKTRSEYINDEKKFMRESVSYELKIKENLEKTNYFSSKNRTITCDTISSVKRNDELQSLNEVYTPKVVDKCKLINEISSTATFIDNYTYSSDHEDSDYDLENKERLFTNNTKNFAGLNAKNVGTLQSKKQLSKKRTSSELDLDSDQSNLSGSSVSEFECLVPKPKKLRIKNTESKLNSIIEDEIQYSILKKYDSFILIIEKLLEEFLDKVNSNEKNIENIIYDPELCILSSFSSDIFGKWNVKSAEKLKMVSTTADMLGKFIGSINFGERLDLMLSLKLCLISDIDLNCTVKELAKILLEEIYEFLKSDNSKYLKSICTEFYSFTHLFNDLKIIENISVVKAFTIFLLLVKRIGINVPKLQKELESNLDVNSPFKLLRNEMCYSSAFIFVFLNNLKFTNSNFIKNNIKSTILCNCVTVRYIEDEKYDIHNQVATLLKIFFFDLRNIPIVSFPADYSESNQLCSFISKKYAQKSYEIEELQRLITNEHHNIIKRAEEVLKHNKFRPRLKSRIISILKKNISEEERKIRIWQYSLILDYTASLSIYMNTKIGIKMSFYFRKLYGISRRVGINKE